MYQHSFVGAVGTALPPQHCPMLCCCCFYAIASWQRHECMDASEISLIDVDIAPRTEEQPPHAWVSSFSCTFHFGKHYVTLFNRQPTWCYPNKKDFRFISFDLKECLGLTSHLTGILVCMATFSLIWPSKDDVDEVHAQQVHPLPFLWTRCFGPYMTLKQTFKAPALKIYLKSYLSLYVNLWKCTCTATEV